MKKSSIKDVALKAGVSIATVSYVLNNTPNRSIKEETTDRIRKAAKELNYTVNKFARSLKTQRSFTLGLIVADIANPYFSQLARYIEDEAEKKGYTIIIGSSDESEQKFTKLLSLFMERMVDGLIIAPVAGTKAAKSLESLTNLPFILIDRKVPAISASAVLINNREIARKTTEHLLASGRENIVLISYESSISSLEERIEGYKAGLAAAGKNLVAHNILKIAEKNIDNDTDRCLNKVFSRSKRPDALFFLTNKLSVSGLRWLLENNINVPKDVAVVAFDETDAYKLFPVSVTHIRQPLPSIAAHAVRMLIDRITTETNPVEITELEAVLKIQASSE